MIISDHQYALLKPQKKKYQGHRKGKSRAAGDNQHGTPLHGRVDKLDLRIASYCNASV